MYTDKSFKIKTTIFHKKRNSFQLNVNFENNLAVRKWDQPQSG